MHIIFADCIIKRDHIPNNLKEESQAEYHKDPYWNFFCGIPIMFDRLLYA